MTADRQELLRTFGRIVANPRDRVLDDLEELKSGESREPVRRHVIEQIKLNRLTADDVAEFVKHQIDRFIVELMFELQDSSLNHDVELALAQGDEVLKLNEISDGLAGDFLSKEGWLTSLSDHARSRFDGE